MTLTTFYPKNCSHAASGLSDRRRLSLILSLFIPAMLLWLLSGISPAGAQESEPPAAPETAVAAETPEEEPLEVILDQVEERYSGSGFSADFHQESTLAAMDITDTASGNLFVKPPDRMRWEYEQPERQVILTDGKLLWIWRPEDNQVMIGDAPAYLGAGKGASFLSDIREIRNSFDVSLEPDEAPTHHRLKLVPKEKAYDIEALYLFVSKESAVVERVVTRNDYGDTTRITLTDYTFDEALPADIFDLDVPPGTDMIQMDGR